MARRYVPNYEKGAPPFFVVLTPGGACPKFDTPDGAADYAEIHASENPGETYYVLCPISSTTGTVVPQEMHFDQNKFVHPPEAPPEPPEFAEVYEQPPVAEDPL